MAHLHRFYVGEGLAESGDCGLPPEEAHHAVRVVRVRPGDAIALFDGRGRQATATVTEARGGIVRAAIACVEHCPAPTTRVELVQAWLHRDKAIEELIRRGTEFGVDAFRFYRARRSERAPREAGDKWTRIAVEVCKQCGRSRLPTFSAAASLEEALEGLPDASRVLAAAQDVMAEPLSEALSGIAPGGTAALVVGPEGDFTEEELGALRARGAHWTSFGVLTFRSEVAAMLGAVLVRYELGDLGPHDASRGTP